MSVSLYYIAKRDTHLSKQEKSICNTIIDTYISKYSLGEMYEPFCAYDNSSPTEENVIFEGATKLPIDEGERTLCGSFRLLGRVLAGDCHFIEGCGVVYTYRRYGYNGAV